MLAENAWRSEFIHCRGRPPCQPEQPTGCTYAPRFVVRGMFPLSSYAVTGVGLARGPAPTEAAFNRSICYCDPRRSSRDHYLPLSDPRSWNFESKKRTRATYDGMTSPTDIIFFGRNAAGFLLIPFRDGHPCLGLCDSRYQGSHGTCTRQRMLMPSVKRNPPPCLETWRGIVFNGC